MPRKRNRVVLGELETAVLNVLWERGPSTVAEVVDALPKQSARHYNTCSTVLTRLAKRGVVRSERAGRIHTYTAVVTREELGREYLGLLRREVFGGSVARLVSALLGEGPPSTRQEKKLRELLRELEKGEGPRRA